MEESLTHEVWKLKRLGPGRILTSTPQVKSMGAGKGMCEHWIGMYHWVALDNLFFPIT